MSAVRIIEKTVNTIREDSMDPGMIRKHIVGLLIELEKTKDKPTTLARRVKGLLWDCGYKSISELGDQSGVPYSSMHAIVSRNKPWDKYAIQFRQRMFYPSNIYHANS